MGHIFTSGVVEQLIAVVPMRMSHSLACLFDILSFISFWIATLLFTSFKKQTNVRKYLQNSITLFLLSAHFFPLSLSSDGHIYYFCATFPDSSLCKYSQVCVYFPPLLHQRYQTVCTVLYLAFFPTYQFILDLCQQSKLSNYSTTIIIYIYIYFYSCIDVQPGFRKGRGTRDQIANILWIIEKARDFQKNIYFCFIS